MNVIACVRNQIRRDGECPALSLLIGSYLHMFLKYPCTLLSMLCDARTDHTEHPHALCARWSWHRADRATSDWTHKVLRVFPSLGSDWSRRPGASGTILWSLRGGRYAWDVTSRLFIE